MTSFSCSKLSLVLHFLPNKLLRLHSRPSPSGYCLPFSVYFLFFSYVNLLCLAHSDPPSSTTLSSPSTIPSALNVSAILSRTPPRTSQVFSGIFFDHPGSLFSKIHDLALNTEPWKVRTGRDISKAICYFLYNSFQSLFSGIVLG